MTNRFSFATGLNHSCFKCHTGQGRSFFLIKIYYNFSFLSHKVLISLVKTSFDTSASNSFKMLGFNINSKAMHLTFHLCLVKPYEIKKNESTSRTVVLVYTQEVTGTNQNENLYNTISS